MTTPSPAISVLVVDDDADVRSTVVEYLASKGFAVDEAANGLEALVKVKRRRPGTVILDLAMPRLGGMETLRYIRAFDPTIDVVIVTGAADAEVHRQAREFGRVSVLSKPLALPELARLLQGGGTAGAGTPPPVAPARTCVLIVDDDEGIRAVLDEYLTLKGFETLLAATAVEATRVLGERTPGVILLDIEMPGLSGLDALPTMIAMAPTAAVIMVSGNSDEGVAKNTLARGAFDYVIKPIDVVYLMRSIETALAAAGG